MQIRVLTLALPAALGLACSHAQGSSRTASAAGKDEAGTATASAAAGGGTSGQEGQTGGASTGGASSELKTGGAKGHDSDRVVSGTVADASGSSLVIQSRTGEKQTLSVVDETAVTIDGMEGKPSDLKPGQDVRASYNEQDGKDVAVKVMARSGRSPAGTSGSSSQGYETNYGVDTGTGTGGPDRSDAARGTDDGQSGTENTPHAGSTH